MHTGADGPAHARAELTNLERQASHPSPGPAPTQHQDAGTIGLAYGGQVEPDAPTTPTGMAHDAFQGIRDGLGCVPVEDTRHVEPELLVIGN